MKESAKIRRIRAPSSGRQTGIRVLFSPSLPIEIVPLHLLQCTPLTLGALKPRLRSHCAPPIRNRKSPIRAEDGQNPGGEFWPSLDI